MTQPLHPMDKQLPVCRHCGKPIYLDHTVWRTHPFPSFWSDMCDKGTGRADVVTRHKPKKEAP